MATDFNNKSKSGEASSAFVLNIGDGFDLLIDSTYKLEIQAESAGTEFSNQSKN